MTEVYSLDGDFPSGLNESQLKLEILSNNSITTSCLDVGRYGDTVNIIFESVISPAEKIILDDLIANYIFEPIPVNPSLYIQNNIIKSDISNTIYTFLGDQPDEIHISKTSQSHYPSIKAAIAANNTENIVFILHPGTYIEDNPLTLPNGCCIIAEGNAENTFIVAQNSTLDILNLGIRCKVEGITFVGAATARGIYFDGTQSGGTGRLSALFECFIVGCNIGIEVDGKNGSGAIDTLYMREILITTTTYSLNKGVYCHSAGQIISSSLNVFGSPSFVIAEGVCCHDVGSKTSITTSSIWFCDYAIHLDNGGEIELQLSTCRYNNIALNIGSAGSNSKINGDLFNALDSTSLDINIDSTDAIIDIQSGIIDILKISNPNDVKINARFQSTQFGAFFHNILGDIVMGTKRVPAKMAVGEGTYDIDGVNIFTNDNLESGTWVDCTSGAVSIGAPPFNIFPSVLTGSCLYIGRNDNPVGIKIHTTTATSSATPNTSLVWEYWNGSSWVGFNISQNTTVQPYYSTNGSFISTVGKYQIRFGITSNTPIVAKTLNGLSKKWVRARIISDISSIPVGEYCKLHVNATEINNNGFIEYYGNARHVADFNKWVIHASNDLPGDSDLFIGQKLGINSKLNLFSSGVVSRIGMTGYIPVDADVGFPLKIKLSIVGNSNTPGDVQFIVRYGTTNVSDSVFLINGEAPATGPNEQSNSIIINIDSIKTEFRGTFSIDISDVLTNPSNGEPDLLWLSVERDSTVGNSNDTYPGNVSLIHFETQYIKMFSGGHILSY